MSDFRGLKGFALARESAYFKLEQEADIQRHRSRLVTQGRIEDIAGGYLMPKRHQTLAESAATFEVLAEVLQQQVRVDDPSAAQRRHFFRKIRGKLPELTDAELRHYRSSLYGVAAVGQIPWARFGRDKYVYHHNQGPTPPSLKWTPQAREAARRALMTGVRSMVYGSLLGGAAVVVAVAVAARALDVSSTEELRLRVQREGPSAAAGLRERLLPLKLWIQEFVEERKAAGAGESEFRRRLAARYPRKAPAAGLDSEAASGSEPRQA